MNDLEPSFSSWPRGRKIAAVTAAVAGYVALACVAMYLAGVLFLLLNKKDPAQAGLTSITQYWQLYADIPQLRRQLKFCIAASAGGLLFALPAWLLAQARPRRALHGAARFATAAEVRRSGLLSGNAPGIIVGRYRGKYLMLRGELSVMLSAPTRSGKGVGVVIPNLLRWPDSVVVLDIKGENYDITAGYRRERGQAVYAFSPFDRQQRSHRWNPLTAVRSGSQRVTDLLHISQSFFPDARGSPSDIFFNAQARSMFLGLGLLVLESDDLPHTVGEMLRQSSGNGCPIRDHIKHLTAARSRQGRPFTRACQDALNRLLANGDGTLSSIVATFCAPLTIFADDLVDAATSGDDFRLEDVRRKRMSIYVRIPPNRLEEARPLLNLFFSQLVSVNTEVMPREDAALKFQCLLLNDEFTAMGHVGVITHAAAFLGGYNLRLLTIVQAMSQLDAVYGDKEARSFSTNHALQILYAPREQRDAEEYSAMLGQFTERATSRGRSRSLGARGSSSISTTDSDQRRAVLLPQEIKELGEERLVVIMENCKPILADKIRYFRDEAFLARLSPPPTVPVIELKGQQQLPPNEATAGEDMPTDALSASGEDRPVHRDVRTVPLEARKAELGARLADLFPERPAPFTSERRARSTPGRPLDSRPQHGPKPAR